MDNSEMDQNTHLPPSLFLKYQRMKPNGLPILLSNDSECETGFDTSLIVGYNDKCPFICTVCKGFPRYPNELRKCGHVFCYDCISQVRSTIDENGHRIPKKCPNCRSVFKTDDIFPFEMTSSALNNIYSSYEIRCPYLCGHVSSPKSMIDHETWTCKLRPVKCTSKDCQIVLPDEQMESHLDNCPKRFVYCNQCQIPMRVNNKEHKCVSPNRETVKCMHLINFFVIYIINFTMFVISVTRFQL